MQNNTVDTEDMKRGGTVSLYVFDIGEIPFGESLCGRAEYFCVKDDHIGADNRSRTCYQKAKYVDIKRKNDFCSGSIA